MKPYGQADIEVSAIYGFATRCAENPADAEDAMQEALCRALEEFDPTLGVDACRQFVRRGIYACFRNRSKGEKARRHIVEKLIEKNLGDPEAAYDQRHRIQIGEDVQHAIARLHSPDDRKLIMLVDIEGYSHREVARMQGTSRHEIRKRLGVIRNKLQHFLSAYAKRAHPYHRVS